MPTDYGKPHYTRALYILAILFIAPTHNISVHTWQYTVALCSTLYKGLNSISVHASVL